MLAITPTVCVPVFFLGGKGKTTLAEINGVEPSAISNWPSFQD